MFPVGLFVVAALFQVRLIRANGSADAMGRAVMAAILAALVAALFAGILLDLAGRTGERGLCGAAARALVHAARRLAECCMSTRLRKCLVKIVILSAKWRRRAGLERDRAFGEGR